MVFAVDSTAMEYLGVRRDVLEKVLIGELLPDFPWDELMSQLDQNDNFGEITWQLPSKDGPKPVQVQLLPLHAVDRDSVLVELCFSGNRNAEIRTRDALTGLPDRRELQWHFERLCEQSSNGTNLAIVFMDLDQFKQVNDQLGHEAGDAVLVALAERWNHCVRDTDLVVRYGGDEFVILLAEIASREAAQPILDRLIKATHEPISIRQHSLQVGVTLGLALTEPGHNDLAELLVAADRDMYRNKQSKVEDSP